MGTDIATLDEFGLLEASDLPSSRAAAPVMSSRRRSIAHRFDIGELAAGAFTWCHVQVDPLSHFSAQFVRVHNPVAGVAFDSDVKIDGVLKKDFFNQPFTRVSSQGVSQSTSQGFYQPVKNVFSILVKNKTGKKQSLRIALVGTEQ